MVVLLYSRRQACVECNVYIAKRHRKGTTTCYETEGIGLLSAFHMRFLMQPDSPSSAKPRIQLRTLHLPATHCDGNKRARSCFSVFGSRCIEDWATTHGHVADSRKGRTVDSLVGETRTSTTRLEIARRVDAFVDEGLAGLDGAGFPPDRADLGRELAATTDAGGTDLSGRDAIGATDLEPGVATERASAGWRSSRGTRGETVGRDRRATSTPRVVDLLGGLSQQDVQKRRQGIANETEEWVEDSILLGHVELRVEIGDGLRCQDAALGTQANTLRTASSVSQGCDSISDGLHSPK
jgi:hypothetical protein